jgi:hypothetical protein
MNKKIVNKLGLFVLMIAGLSSCYDVEEGYRITYSESPAVFNVIAPEIIRGAVGDTISFEIQAQTQSDIKSVVVSSTLSGKEGTGFYIPAGETDPLIDHAYGTIQKNTRKFDIYYNYVIAEDSNDVTINFDLIDGDGKKSAEYDVITVPSITHYNNVMLFTNTTAKTDGFSTVDGSIYRELSNYETVTSANQTVQESLDIIFLVWNNTAILAGPYDGWFSSNMKVRNKTKFMKLSDSMTSTDFDALTNATLSYYTDKGKVDKGTTSISDIKVGDLIGFKTDFASANSYKYGILRVKAIHPTNCDWYEGVSYMIDMDVVTQISKN